MSAECELILWSKSFIHRDELYGTKLPKEEKCQYKINACFNSKNQNYSQFFFSSTFRFKGNEVQYFFLGCGIL
jgi:hypothetical protein